MFSKDIQDIFLSDTENNAQLIDEMIIGLSNIKNTLNKYRIRAIKACSDNLSDELNSELHELYYKQIASLKKEDIEIQTLIDQLRSHKPNQLNLDNIIDVLPKIQIDVILDDYSSSPCPCCHKSQTNEFIPSIIHIDSIYSGEISILSKQCPHCKQKFITRRTYHLIKKSDLLNGLNIEFVFYYQPKLIDEYDFLVVSNINNCTSNKHKVIDIQARVGIITLQGKDTYISLPACYCYDCDRYRVLKDDFKKIKDVIRCKVIDETSPSNNISQSMNYFDLDRESYIHSRGYNVNCNDNLSQMQRQRILKDILNSGELSKEEILSYLSFWISSRENTQSWKRAVGKWQVDRKFVECYTPKKADVISVKSLTVTGSSIK